MAVYVMLVDDEYRICNGLASIIRKQWPDIRIEKFDNGIDALESIRKQCPDFLLTDINMPEMSGLELIEKARALGLRYYAILTGYDEFELVQKALRLQAIDYLMKPVDIPQLHSLIEKILGMHEAEEKKRMESLQMLLWQYALLDPEQAGILPKAELPEMFHPGCRIGVLVGMTGPMDFPEEDGYIRDCIRKETYLELGEDLNRRKLLLIPVEPGQDEAFEQNARKWAEKGVLSGYAIGDGQPESLHEAYRTALEETSDMLKRLGMLAEDRGLTHAEVKEELQEALQRCTDLCGRLELVLGFSHQVHRVWSPWNEMGALKKFRLLPLSEQAEWTGHFLESLDRMNSVESREVYTAMEIIRQNLSSDLKPGDVAGLVHMNASYFSSLFHRETGMTLVDYINLCRIARSALQLLRHPDQSIDMVSIQAGFPNVQYFHRVFKSLTGLTPNVFRQENA